MNTISGQRSETMQLKDAVGFAFFSTSLPKEKFFSGHSQLFVIDKQGNTKMIENRGLELNAPIQLGNSEQIIFHQKKSVQVFNASLVLKEYPLPPSCHVTAAYMQSSGYVKGANNSPKDSANYYALFNVGFDLKSNYQKYVSILRWGNAEQHQCTTIPYYVDAVGEDDKYVYVLSYDEHNKKFNLIRLELGQGKQHVKEELTPLQPTYNSSILPLSRLMSRGEHLYLVYSDLTADQKIRLNVMEIHKTNHRVQVYPLHTYANDPGGKYYSFGHNGTGIIEDTLYFVDGFGTILPFDLSIKQPKGTSALQGFTRKEYLNDEQSYLKGEHYYLFRFDEQKQIHILDQFRIKDGNFVKSIEIPAIVKQRNKDLFMYDFKMLREL
ncbi:hypothetical protein [Paenibacillus sp. 481]|uniref:hypothetical protein n=1 Tax=Paenibacillus sp. 481 TaxID=2835869 RepID=UPI001E2D530C|nr:hypothetical protein [Paenibacillus sp. 481]UHA75252.1 hypothetical protein KIK04_09705 [Paenibacillus sp. 481]